jgi:hypothetical protein
MILNWVISVCCEKQVGVVTRTKASKQKNKRRILISLRRIAV